MKGEGGGREKEEAAERMNRLFFSRAFSCLFFSALAGSHTHTGTRTMQLMLLVTVQSHSHTHTRASVPDAGRGLDWTGLADRNRFGPLLGRGRGGKGMLALLGGSGQWSGWMDRMGSWMDGMGWD